MVSCLQARGQPPSYALISLASDCSKNETSFHGLSNLLSSNNDDAFKETPRDYCFSHKVSGCAPWKPISINPELVGNQGNCCLAELKLELEVGRALLGLGVGGGATLALQTPLYSDGSMNNS